MEKRQVHRVAAFMTDSGEWMEYALLNSDEVIELGLILKAAKADRAVLSFTIIPVVPGAMSLPELKLTLPRSLAPYLKRS